MQIKSHIVRIAAIIVFSVSVNAHADTWNCSRDDLVREVIIEYPQGGSIPCDVVYKKQTEGVEDQVLWSAENEEGYCEEKARELVENLESWGWVCLETVSPEASTETEADAEPEAGAESDADTETEADAITEGGSDY
ncbi:MAG: hypothetical protein JSW45_06945 [Thiotrichales bacterium]|nr:MAG: hypothetical protein JSW45_06945 [Thiotrichales bacterium]